MGNQKTELQNQKSKNDFYSLTQQTGGSIFAGLSSIRAKSGEPPPELPLLLQLRRGQAESPAWFLVQAAEFDPQPISVARLRVRDIYASEKIVFALLELLASEKWLEPTGGDEYILTQPGHEVVEGMFRRTRQAIAELERQYLPAVIEPSAVARLESLLARIIEASLSGDDPPGNWCLRHSRNRAPAVDASPLEKINHYTADFNAYRDDAHMAAWQPLEIDAYAWEAFSFVYDGLANSAAEIDQQLNYRGYSFHQYAAALEKLENRGWLRESASDAGRYVITETGQTIRQEAERQTDTYFYAPWACLSDSETADLHLLLLDMNDALSRL